MNRLTGPTHTTEPLLCTIQSVLAFIENFHRAQILMLVSDIPEFLIDHNLLEIEQFTTINYPKLYSCTLSFFSDAVKGSVKGSNEQKDKRVWYQVTVSCD